MRSSFALVASAFLAAPAFAQSYVNFESPQVHPIRLSSDGSRLFVANTADSRLSVFDLSQPSSPLLLKEIPVGIEPVSVAPRPDDPTNDEVWVVNHESDSVSIVSVSQGIVTDTIYVEDEPCDVVFAGEPLRAYVSVARSNEIRVFDPATHGPLAVIPVFGEGPRALLVRKDGLKDIVVAVFTLSGNRTTLIPFNLAPPPPPPTNTQLPAPPQVGLIVDATNPTWAPSVIKYTMPDNDAVEIDTATLSVSRYYSRIGTINFGIAVVPSSGDLFVVNTDANNLTFFEPNLRGNIVKNQITRITTGTTPVVTPVDLNPGGSSVASSIAQPTDVVYDGAHGVLWVAGFGTDRIARVDTSGNVLARIDVGSAHGNAVDSKNMRGPRALAIQVPTNRLYIQNRISNTILVMDTATSALLNEIPVGSYDPTPAAIRNGRGFLYDAKLGNGNASCAACHVDGDKDLTGWNLGDPGGSMQTVPDPVFGSFVMHPMKGPMTTQSLKGLVGVNPLHWRGDRSDFTAFNPAFGSLLGGAPISVADMNAFKAFVETMRFEPNPNQNLDRSLPTLFQGANPQLGQNTFTTNFYQPLLTCNTCHALPTGTLGNIIPAAALQETQAFNIPQLRDMYQKKNFVTTPGAQTRMGFGFLHDGTFPTLFSFLSQPVFGNVTGNVTFKNNLQAFLMCMDTGMAPAVGYSRTVTQLSANLAPTTNDVTLLTGQAAAGNADLIGKGKIDGALRGLLYQPAQGNFKTDKTGVGPFTWTQLQAKATAGLATFTLMGVPPGSGVRMGIDRDLDGVLDGDETGGNGFSVYGAPSPPCAGPLSMSVTTPPTIGNALFALTCANAPPATLALGLVSNIQDLAGTPFFGFNLHVGLAASFLDAVDMASDSFGLAIGPAPIPNNPGFVGITLYAQTLVVNPCAPFTLAGSNGLAFTFQAP